MMIGEKVDFFETHYFLLNRVLLSVVGLWPYLDVHVRIIRRSVVLFIFFISITCQIAKLFTSEWSMNLMCQVLPFILVSIGALMKYSLYCIKNEKIKELLDSVRHTWNNLESKEESIIMETCFKDGQLYTVYWPLLVFIGASSYFLISTMPLILDIFMPLNETRPRHPPMLVECFFDQQKYFHSTLVFLSICAFTVVSAAIATKITFVSIVLHACGIFRIASYRLQHVFDDRRDMCIIRDRVYGAVSFHERAIKIILSVNECYEWPDLCINLMLPAVVISFSLYCVRIFIGQWDFLLKSCIVAGAELFSLFIFLNPGQMLINSSSLIFRSAYFSRWYTATPSEQKLLLLIMHRSTTPVAIVMGRLATASMDTFARILQTCLSYFTVLCSL